MWGFAFDSASSSLCRGYAAVLGGFPKPCLSRGGTPMLALTVIVIFAAVVITMIIRSARSRR